MFHLSDGTFKLNRISERPHSKCTRGGTSAILESIGNPLKALRVKVSIMIFNTQIDRKRLLALSYHFNSNQMDGNNSEKTSSNKKVR